MNGFRRGNEVEMKQILLSPRQDSRGVLLSARAGRPLRSTGSSNVAQGKADPLLVLEQGLTEVDRRFLLSRPRARAMTWTMLRRPSGSRCLRAQCRWPLRRATRRTSSSALFSIAPGSLPQHRRLKAQQPFKAVLDGNMPALAASGEQGMMQPVAVTHAGMTSEEFAKIASDWLATARDPRFRRPYTELVYQPMLELLGLS